jgi:imidazole glycerol-phosphate synthase subunit HisH
VSLALVDYGAGNLQSVRNALKAAGAKDVIVTADPDDVLRADRVVLPGVGAFAHCMNALASIDGMVDTIASVALDKPFLGICVGMQLMAEYGCEHGTHDGLNLVAGYVNPLIPNVGVKVPHMGWNEVIPVGPKSLIEPGEAYFLHSYAYVCGQWPSAVRAVTNHGGEVVAAIQSGPAIGVQFHPEKSQAYGLAFLARFLDWRP